MASPEGMNPATGARIENLLDQLRDQTRRLGETWHAREDDRLRHLAGQLTSLAEDAGHAHLRERAAELEQLLLAEESEASAICERIEYLIQQCKKAAGQ